MTARRAVLLFAFVLAVGCQSKAPPEDPLAKYQRASAEQAKTIGEAIEKGFAEGHPEVFDSYLDFDAMAVRLAQMMELTGETQKGFIDGFKKGVVRKESMGKQIQLSFGEGASMKFLRAHAVGQQQRAVLRILSEDGMVNFYDLVVSVDPSGTPRVTDMENYATGELLSESMRSLMGTMLKDVKKSFFERLLTKRDPKKDAQLEAVSTEMPKIRGALAAGKHAEAMQMFNALPPEVQSTRVGMITRMSCAQGMGDAEYERALDSINTAFPDDPSLALLQVDRHFLKKDWAKALEALKRVSRGVGGDAYLDTMQATVLMEVPDLDGAERMARRAIKTEPTLLKAWWTAVGVAIAQKDHAETANLLTEIEQRFDLALSDLQGEELYAEFVRSKEYRAWMKRPRVIEEAALGGE